MRNLFIWCLCVIFVSCSDAVAKPANLIEKDEMSQIIADFAVAGEIDAVKPKANLSAESTLILKKYGIKGQDFVESYQYYISKPRTLEKIFDNAQQEVMKKNPEAEKYIMKKRQNTKIAIPNDR